MSHSKPDDAPPPHVGPAIAGWLVPGLGHLLLGRTRQGLWLLAAIGGLWVAGLLIGGISVIDHQNESEWFVRAGQVFVGPSLGVNALHQALKPHADPAESAALVPSLGRVHEQGVLFTGLAGLLNLLAILDALFGPAARSEQREQQT